MAKRALLTPPPASLMAANRDVFEYLHGKAAHSDTVSVVWASVKDLPGVVLHCSDRHNFGYVVVCGNNVVFGLVEGMKGVTLRVPRITFAALITEGAEPRPAIGPDWIFMELFGKGGFENRLPKIAQEAFAYAALPSDA